jgi:putative inorganic carbon (hco3(-)) transporter
VTDRLKLYVIYGSSLAFLAMNVYLLLQDKYWGLLLPLLLLMAILYTFSLEKVMLLITFFTPLAVNLKSSDFNVGISLPTEAMLFAVMLIFLMKLILDGGYDRRITRHPVSIAIFINLIWIFITCFTSELPIVSVKFIVSRLWFVVPFFFLAILLFKDISYIRKFHWAYVLPLALVIFYTLYNHSTYGFDKPHSNMVMKPFYNDHTAYGAVIAFFLPVFAAFVIARTYKRSFKIFTLAVLAILVTGIIFSYSRAAWISVAFALGVYLIILFKIKFRWVALSLIILLGFFYIFRYQFIEKLEKNKQDSSTDFVEHVQSISNISSDASNLERINRWSSAIRLFRERPIFGWGPGTYQFVYAPFQRSKEKTIISTNYGDMGNAHSEYIGPLSESGVLGMLTFLAIVIVSIRTGMRVYKRARDREVKMLALVAMLGLITYYIHGFMNNFLDTDKASVPFWAFTAMLVALDIYHVEGKENLADSSNRAVS